MFRRLFASLLLILAGVAATANAAETGGLQPLAALRPVASCASLTGADISAAVGSPVTFKSVSEVAGDKPYCRVLGTIAPQITFEVRLPLNGWTQRYLQTGCGGLCGSLNIRPEKTLGCLPVTNGEIVLASTDMGHSGPSAAGWGANPQQREDFAHRGVHLTALAAKALTAKYYGKAPRFSYFSGCSDGGREALIEAQRYPGDFDGIGAGAPASYFSLQNSMHHAWSAGSNTGPDGKAILGAVDLPVLQRGVLAACDALDGLRDGQLTDPRQCRFDPATVQCRAAYEPGQCLTSNQVAVARKIYDGARDAKGQRLTVGGLMPGSETGWAGVAVPRASGGGIFGAQIALDSINNVLFTPNPDPAYTLSNWPFDAATFARLEPARALYNSENPNLAAFAARGGKLILWHGWSDPHISPLGTIAYFNNVGSAMGTKRRDSFVRLFMFPGMGHCSGGDGPNDFALLQSLMAWVEGGAAPDMVIATRRAPTMEGLPGPGGPPGLGGPPGMGPGPSGPPGARPMPQMAAPPLPPRSRPIYAYPAVAKYSGKGDVETAIGFVREMPKRLPLDNAWLGAH